MRKFSKAYSVEKLTSLAHRPAKQGEGT